MISTPNFVARSFVVVRFDAYCVTTANPFMRAVTSSIGDGLDAPEAALLFAIEHARTDVDLLAGGAANHRIAGEQHGRSSREQDIGHAMLRGLSDKEIASTLDVGVETVKAHARAAFAKLSVRGRGGLLAKVGA